MLSIEINAFVSDTSNQMIISTFKNFNCNECKFFMINVCLLFIFVRFCRLISASLGSCSGGKMAKKMFAVELNKAKVAFQTSSVDFLLSYVVNS